MSAPIFVDTAALIALLSRDDTWHVRAREQFSLLARQRRNLLTTSAVMFELLDGAAARGPLRAAAVRLSDSIRQSLQWNMVHVTADHMRAGEALYAGRMDISGA